MSSFKDLVKQVNANKNTVIPNNQYQREEDEEDKSHSSFKDLVRKVNDGAIKVGSTYNSTQVNDWFTGAKSVYNEGYSYLSKDGYKAPNQDILKKIDEKLDQQYEVGMYLRTNRDMFADYDSAYKSYVDSVSYLNSLRRALNESNSVFSQWKTEDDYKTAVSGWLNPDAETNSTTVAMRKEKYESNQKRIAEIEAALPWYGKTFLPSSIEKVFLSKEKDALMDELDALKAENNQYMRTQGVLDSYYGPVTPEFTQNAAYRNYSNASKDELWAYDMSVSAGSEALSNGGYVDEDGNRRDSKGNIVQYANAPEVQDKLGMFLSATDDDITEADNRLLVTNGNYTDTWAELIKEGDINGWKYLKEDEINRYYDLRKREGQAAAYKFLEAMTPTLTKRATEETTEWIYAQDGWSQFGLNVASIPMNVFGGAFSFADDAIHILKGEEINPYSRAHSLQNAATDIRTKTATDINTMTGNAALPWVGTSWGDVYQSVMSAADSALGVALGGKAYGVLMGMGAASSEMKRLYEQGASMGQIAAGGILAGAAEMIFEKYSIDKLVSMGDTKTIKAVVLNLLKQGGIEASEEMATEIANTITNAIVMGSQSDWVDVNTFAKNVVNAGIGGFISGGFSGGVGATGKAIGYNFKASEYGQHIIDKGGVDELQNLAMEMAGVKDGLNAKAIGKLSDKVSSKATAGRVGKLADMIGDTNAAQSMAEIQEALIKQGLSKKDASRVSEYLYSATQGKELTNEQATEVENNDKISHVYVDLIGKLDAPAYVRDQKLARAINGEEYRRILEAAQLPQETAETTGDTVVTEAKNETQTDQATAVEAPAANGQQVTGKSTGKESLQVAEESTVAEEAETKTVTLEEVSQKYGAQAQAMISTYTAGQDVAKFDAAYQVAYDMGKSGVSLSYAMDSDATSYLTKEQRQLAYDTGKDAADTNAKAKDAENKKATNGKTGRKKGVVRGDGVTVKDLDEAFNMTQSKAYKYLVDVAEATGVDIVLYKSKANEKGKFIDEKGKEIPQGKYRAEEEPGVLYIDLNAGLRDIKDANKLHRYFMLRTFAHEFTHFIEKWNPIQYNEFRKVVFDTMTERGENLHDLIEDKQRQNPGMSYDKASREVVAEAMVDVLPDSNFVQNLAQNHKTIFQKLLEKLKEFVENLRSYFDTIGGSYNQGAIALKEQSGDTVKYLDSIVKMWDQIAVQAVENYQQTVATEEVTVSKEETTTTDTATADKTEAVEEAKPVEVKQPVTQTDAYGFTISDNAEHGSLEISFEGKPSDAVRDVLKDNKFRWHRNKKVWYGYGDRQAITDALHAAYEADNVEASVSEPEQSEFEKSFWSATQEERDEVVEAINQNTKISHIAPTEIRESADVVKNEEVNTNGENVDNTGTVQQSESDGRGAAPVLDELQAEDVPGDGGSRDTVADTGERGQPSGRDGDQPDSQRTGSGSSKGDRQSGDLRRNDGLTTEEHQKAAEKLHEEVVEQIAQQSTEQPKGRNFVIGDSLDLPSGEKSRYKANIEAIKLVKKLETEGRYATEAEQEILSKYVGWGGLANAFDQRKTEWAKEFAELKELLTDDEYSSARGSTLNAHYTDISVIKAMYDGLNQLGFSGGRMLEPSSGVGNFVGAMPADMAAKVRSWTMVELDGITGLIAKHLYPNADVRIQGFEKANIPNNFMDVAISNVPFGNYPITDKAYPKKVTSAIHNYFFAKTLDKVRPGGIVMFITSSYTMNSRDNAVRSYIMQRADLLGAIRLPDTAFKGNAGTEVVTDILILKKRAANTAYAGEDFLEAPYQYISGYNGAYINDYFTNHPEMVLGTASFDGGMYRGNNLTYKALEGKGSLADQIREAFKNIQGKMDYPAQFSPEKTNFAVERANKKTKENGLVVKDGKVYKNTGGELVEQNVAKGVAERISGMLEIRDAAKELQTYLQQGLKDTEIRKARTKLNNAYDAFVKKHGFINSQANKNAIKDDPDRYSILALENWNPETKKATKADIFSKNTIAPNRTVTSAKDVAEGLIVSVNQTGGVDAALIAKLTGKTEAEVTRELIDSRQAFKNRDGQLETAEVYLSGNVRAKLRDAEALVPIDSDYQKNVEALKAIIPEDVGYQDIFVNPGTPWIPNSVYSDFVAHMLGTVNHDWNKAVDVTRNKDTGNFTVELRSKYLKTNSYNTQKWGTSRRSFLDLFDAMLNSKSVVVKDKLADGSYVVNKDATAAANEKIENIQKEFQEWLWQDEARRTELATLYNETFNSVVTPKYNGDNLTVNGANAMKPLRPHQRNAVQRVIASGGNTLLAHKVGAGKTYEMAAAAMKLKQLGLVQKPMFAVPKSLVAQWGTEFMDFFPTAKLLVAEAGDFTAANRKVFMNRIANGNYDAVIVSYEQFEKLPVSADFTRELYQEQIDSVIAAIEEAKAEKGGKALSVKDLEKKRKSLQAKIDKLSDTAKDEDNIDFEQLGVDSIFVDEAHNFKNLFYTTSMTNVSGLGNKDGSKRAFDLYTKVRYLQKLNGGRGIVFATATPVMNSMSEMYIMQKYLQPDLLDQLGLSTFDAWAKQFGEVVNGVEIKPSGQGYRVKQSFSRFKNMSELQLLFRNFADVLTDIPGLKIPKMKGGRVNVVVCEPGQFQQDYMKELEKRADNIKNVDPSVDNMLKITSDGRKISYTQRMIEPTLPYEDGCKIYRCADNVVQLYQDSKDIKGTQLVFCDMATPKGKSNTASTETEEIETDMESAKLYDDLKARLVKGGIPAKQIAFIHEADTDAKKKKLFADVNDGTVRVLIGSTGKMGVGMNAQKRVVAIHHLDAPWRPGDVEQRNGRAFRQGNINDEVECFTYVTEGSFDARLWDILERKQNFINQVMNGENVGRETEDTGEVTLSAAEVKALASGSPLIMEQVQLDTDIKKLESLYRAHRSAVANARSRLETDKGNIATLEKYISNGKADMAARVDTYSDGKFSITVGKQKFTEKKDAGVALMAAATANSTEAGYTTIGKFAGFDLRVIKTHEGIKGLISGQQGYSFNTYPANTTFMINHLISKVEAMDETVKQWEQALAETRKDLAEQEKMIDQPFAKQAELDQKRARYNEVMEILNPKEEQALDSVAEDDVQEQSRSYLEYGDIRDDIYYPKHPADAHAFLRSYANKTSHLKDGETANIIVFTENDVYFVKADGYLQGSIETVLPILGNEDLIDDMIKEFRNDTNTSTETLDTWAETVRSDTGRNDWDHAGYGHTGETRQADALDGGESESDSIGNYWNNYGYSSWEELLEAVKNGAMVMDDDGNLIVNEQLQQRTNALTDREVLAMAASEVKVSDLTDGEKDALNIFKQRLEKLESLQTERAEQGRIYKEQQFGAKVDREKAAQTLNRMHVLDDQIQNASAELLSVEKTTVLREVLKKARKIVELEERQRGDEKLKRWRDRRKNADAIKKYRERLKKDVDDLTSWVLHPNNKDVVKHVPDVLKSSVIPFLSSIDFTSKQQLRGGDATKADKEFLKRLKGLKSALKPNQNAQDIYADYSDLPPNFMERLQSFIDAAQELVDNNSGEFVVNQMSSDELRELSQIVRTLKEYVKNFNNFHVNAMFQHVSDAGDNTIDELGQMANAGAKTGAVSNFVLWQQMRPAYAFERFGEGGIAIYDGLRRGQAQLAFNTKVIVDFSEKAYTEAEVKAWEKQIKEIKLGNDIVKMPVSTIMSFYELSKRPQALGHILGQGIRVATYKNGGKKISDVGHTVTMTDVQTIIGTLTDRQKEVADSLQKFMQEQGGKWGNYVSVKRFGEELFGEDHYFPINSDGRHLSANADEHPSAASLYALLNMGFTKNTQEGANNRLVLYSIFDVFSNHMASMAQYNALALPVVDALKWFNYQQKSEPDENGKRLLVGSVRDQMDRVYGVPEETRPGSGRQGYAQSFVINILKAFNGTEAQGTAYDGFGLQTLHNYNRAQVAYNLRVVMQQPLAITRAAQLLNYGSIFKGMSLNPAAIKRNIEEMRKYSGIAAWKSLGFYDVNISRGLTSIIKHSDTVLDKITDVGMWGAEKADTLTWAGIWSACKEEVIHKQKLTPKNDGFYEAVAKLFEEVIYKTQVVDSVLTKNEFMRDKGFFARAVGSFMSEPVTTASMLVNAYDKYHMDIQRGMTRQQAWKKNGKMIVRTAYVYGVGALVLAAVQAVADAFRDDDDYETWLEKWLEAFGGNLVDELMPFNKLPILSDFYDLAKELISIFGVDTYGNPPQSVFMQWYDSLVKGAEIIYDKISGEDTNYTWYGGAYKLLQAVSGMSGLPMAATTREIVTAWNNIVGAMAPSLKVKTYDPGEKNEIKYAYQDGYLTAEEAAAELLKQGIVDTESEAYWMVEGWEAGEGYSRYDAIYDAVRNGGNIDAAMDELTTHGYKEKDVLSQVKNEIGSWYKNGEITKQQATDMLTKYFDLDSEEITATVNKWSCKVVTGIAFEDIKEEFMEGNITEARAVEMYVRYGGYTKEKATETVTKWRSEKETGIAYDDIKDAFMAGEISSGDAKNMYITYGGYTEQDAGEKVTTMAFVKQHPDCDGISYAAIESYQTYCESYGVPAGTFYNAWKYNSSTNADVDVNGDSISGSKKVKVLAYIDSLNLTYSQKDSIYYAFGWAESKIYEAPWH